MGAAMQVLRESEDKNAGFTPVGSPKKVAFDLDFGLASFGRMVERIPEQVGSRMPTA
jgi:hypothetical protein